MVLSVSGGGDAGWYMHTVYWVRGAALALEQAMSFHPHDSPTVSICR